MTDKNKTVEILLDKTNASIKRLIGVTMPDTPEDGLANAVALGFLSRAAWSLLDPDSRRVAQAMLAAFEATLGETVREIVEREDGEAH